MVSERNGVVVAENFPRYNYYFEETNAELENALHLPHFRLELIVEMCTYCYERLTRFRRVNVSVLNYGFISEYNYVSKNISISENFNNNFKYNELSM